MGPVFLCCDNYKAEYWVFNKNRALFIFKIRLSPADNQSVYLSIFAFVLSKDALEYRLPYLQVVFAMVQTFRTGVQKRLLCLR